MYVFVFFFFFQAEDGIRDDLVTGVQTCALPISHRRCRAFRGRRMAPGTSTAMNGKPMSASGPIADMRWPSAPMVLDAIDPSLPFDDQFCCHAQAAFQQLCGRMLSCH